MGAVRTRAGARRVVPWVVVGLWVAVLVVAGAFAGKFGGAQENRPVHYLPDSADSTGNGTSTAPGKSFPIVGFFPSTPGAYCQTPLRFNQSARTICGRGYSRHTLAGVTSLAHRVISGACFASHSAPNETGATAPTRANPTRKFRQALRR